MLLVVLLFISAILLWIKAFKSARFILSGTVLTILALAIFPVGHWFLCPLETRFPIPHKLPESIDGIIMLGGAEKIHNTILWRQVQLNAHAERYLAFMQLVRAYPGARAVFTGGTGSMMHQEMKGTHVAKQLLKEQGIDTDRIVFESESRNTYENALYSHRMVKPGPDEQWILVTSASHMPRSVGCFKKAGWEVIPYPVDHHTHPTRLWQLSISFSYNLERLRFALREWAGLVAYYLTGKTERFFPGPGDTSLG